MTLASNAARKSNSKGQRQRKSTYKGTKKGSRSKRGPFESRYVSRNVNVAIKQSTVTLSRDKQLNAHLFNICILCFSLQILQTYRMLVSFISQTLWLILKNISARDQLESVRAQTPLCLHYQVLRTVSGLKIIPLKQNLH